MAGRTSDANSGGSSYSARDTWPGLAYADSHADSTPPDDRPLTIVGRPIDDVDEADEVVAHVVERVAAGRARAAALAAQVDGEHLEVLGEQRHRRLVAPPRLGLARDEQQRRLRRVAARRVVHLHLAEVDELLGERVRNVRALGVPRRRVRCWRPPQPSQKERDVREGLPNRAGARLHPATRRTTSAVVSGRTAMAATESSSSTSTATRPPRGSTCTTAAASATAATPTTWRAADEAAAQAPPRAHQPARGQARPSARRRP